LDFLDYDERCKNERGAYYFRSDDRVKDFDEKEWRHQHDPGKIREAFYRNGVRLRYKAIPLRKIS
jgi:hypothetical protein